jgi:hypothetical protein
VASVQILHGVVSLYGMQIGERAALMFAAICRLIASSSAWTFLRPLAHW